MNALETLGHLTLHELEAAGSGRGRLGADPAERVVLDALAAVTDRSSAAASAPAGEDA